MPQFRPVDQWLAAVSGGADALAPTLDPLYGCDRPEQARRLVLWQQALAQWRGHFGAGDVLLARAPGRISLNPHSDHQGSFVLYGCHSREMVVVAGRRDDQQVVLSNAGAEYAGHESFDLVAEPGRDAAAWDAGWLHYLDSPAVKASVAALRDPKERHAERTGSLNYVRAALLRLAHRFPGRAHGLNLALAGDIPSASGMSSSSAIVVATALAAMAAWQVELPPWELVELLGEAEWYVGTRGGSGDHAAMLLGQRGHLTNIQFEPPLGVRTVRTAEWPSDYRLWLVNSGVRSEKSSEEKRLFNGGVFAYKFACAELMRALPGCAQRFKLGSEVVDSVVRLADFNDRTLPLALLYGLLSHLPAEAPIRELRKRYGDVFEAAALSFFDTANLRELPATVPLRGAAIYGLARADRGLVQDGLLAEGTPESMKEFGLLHAIAHNGDRRFFVQADGSMAPWRDDENATSDVQLARMSRQAHYNPTDILLALRRQPGFYGASIEALDRIVDLSHEVPGVLGAGLMGAGGGGIVLVVGLPECKQEGVTAALAKGYFEPSGVPEWCESWHSAAGAAVVELPR